MPCDPNTLIEAAKCLEACIHPHMMQAVQVSLLCQILDSGGGGGGGGGGVTSFNGRAGAVTLELADVTSLVDSRYVLKSGDAMTGPLTLSDGVVGTPQLAFTAEPTTGLFRPAAGEIGFSILGTQSAELSATGLRLGALSASWSSDFTTASDVFLQRDAANVLALRNGTDGQEFRVYNTYSGAGVDFELIRVLWAGNGAFLTTDSGGTGVSRTMTVGTNGASALRFQTAGSIWFSLGATGTLTGALGAVTADTPILSLSQVWNNAAVLFTAFTLNVTNTASAANSLLMDLRLGGVSLFSFNKSGAFIASGQISAGTNVIAGATGRFQMVTRTEMSAPSDGVMLFRNNAQTDFNRMQFGGTTSAFPSIKRSAALLQARLADDSAYCDFEARILRVATAFTVATLPAAGTAGRIAYVTDALAPAFLAIVVGGGAIITTVFDNGTNWVAV